MEIQFTACPSQYLVAGWAGDLAAEMVAWMVVSSVGENGWRQVAWKVVWSEMLRAAYSEWAKQSVAQKTEGLGDEMVRFLDGCIVG